MNINNIKANGISWHAPAAGIQSILEAAIAIYRMRFTNEEIFNSFEDDDNYHLGVRFSDNNTVAVRIMSAITREASASFGETEDPERGIKLAKYIEEWFESLTAADIDTLILDGMRDCASADHWYKYEKQWD